MAAAEKSPLNKVVTQQDALEDASIKATLQTKVLYSRHA
jgi:hypothetical protein